MSQDRDKPTESARPASEAPPGETASRRSFVTASGVAMTAGLAAGYGTLGVVAFRYMYPSSGPDVGWRFVAIAREMKLGESLDYVAPNGAKIVVARQNEPGGDEDTADNFIALSSVCPHLGCQVHWEPQNDRFFCPCHNGAFDPQGQATEGPPAKAHQQLVRFPLKVDSGLLFIEAPLTTLVQADDSAAATQVAANGAGECSPATVLGQVARPVPRGKA